MSKRGLLLACVLFAVIILINGVSAFDNEDVNEDGNISVEDIIPVGFNLGLSLTNCGVVNNWCARTDVSRDGKVNVNDIMKIGIKFVTQIPPSYNVPNWALPYGIPSTFYREQTALVGTLGVRVYTAHPELIHVLEDWMQHFKAFYEGAYKDALPRDRIGLNIKYEIVVVPSIFDVNIDNEDVRRDLNTNWGYTWVHWPEMPPSNHGAYGGGGVIYSEMWGPSIDPPLGLGWVGIDHAYFLPDFGAAQEYVGGRFNLTNKYGIYGTASFNSGGAGIYNGPMPIGVVPERNIAAYHGGMGWEEQHYYRGIARSSRMGVGWMDANHNGMNDLFEVMPVMKNLQYINGRVSVNASVGLFAPKGYYSGYDWYPPYKIGGNWSVDRIYRLWGKKNGIWSILQTANPPGYVVKFNMSVGEGYTNFTVETVAGWTTDNELNNQLNPNNTAGTPPIMLALVSAVMWQSPGNMNLAAVINNMQNYGPPILSLQQHPSIAKVEFFERIDGTLVKVGEDTNGSLPLQWMITIPIPSVGYHIYTAKVIDIWGQESRYANDIEIFQQPIYMNVAPEITEFGAAESAQIGGKLNVWGRARDEIEPGVYEAPQYYGVYLDANPDGIFSYGDLNMGGGNVNADGTFNGNVSVPVMLANTILGTGNRPNGDPIINQQCVYHQPGIRKVYGLAQDRYGRRSNNLTQSVSFFGSIVLPNNPVPLMNVTIKMTGFTIYPTFNYSYYDISIKSLASQNHCLARLNVTFTGRGNNGFNYTQLVANMNLPAENVSFWYAYASSLYDGSLDVRLWDDVPLRTNIIINMSAIPFNTTMYFYGS